MAAPIIVLDFDGTLTQNDVGDAICERFARPDWRDSIELWLRAEINLGEAQQRVWGSIRAGRAELSNYAREVGKWRAGAAHLFDAAKKGHVELVLASGGFDFYIDLLLGERRELFREVFYNRMIFSESGLKAIFPHADLACKCCAVCKGKILHRYLNGARRVLFCGDGDSDRCAAATKAELFAVRSSELDVYCREHRVAYTAFDDFEEVLDAAVS